MKKILSTLFLIAVSILLVACNTNSKSENVLNVGVDFYPMPEIVELIREDMQKEGIELNVKKSNYTTQNQALLAKELDINLIQHRFFMDDFNKANKGNLVKLSPIYYSNFSIYSKKYQNIKDVADNSKVLIPSDAANVVRSIYLLSQAKLINLDGLDPLNVSLEEVTNNKTINFKNLSFERLSIVTAPKKFDEGKHDLAIMYPTYIKAQQLDFSDIMIFNELPDDISKEFAISLVGREDNEKSRAVKLFVKYITSDKVRNFLIENYAWASKPAF